MDDSMSGKSYVPANVVCGNLTVPARCGAVKSWSIRCWEDWGRRRPWRSGDRGNNNGEAELLPASMVEGKRRGRRVAGMVVDFLVECDWEAEEEVALDEWVVGRGRRPDIVWRCCWGCEGIQTGKAGVWRRGYWHDGGCGVGAVPAVELLTRKLPAARV